ncbi:MAG: lysophospholipid acyltransferase family protein [Gemmatimonadales bacterium]
MIAIRTDIHNEVFGTGGDGSLFAQLRAAGLRPVLRLTGIAVWTGGLFVVLVAGMWAATPWQRARLWWRNQVVRRWARGVAWFFGMRMRQRGRPPAAPFFLVSNHLSYLDIILILGHLDGVFVAKRELSQWPILGYLTRLVGTIFLDRTRQRDAHRALDRIDARIALGDGVVAFPEGTSSGGDDVYPMRAALFEWAAANNRPVHLATLSYSTGDPAVPARERVCWWGDMPFLPHAVDLLRSGGSRRASIRRRSRWSEPTGASSPRRRET